MYLEYSVDAVFSYNYILREVQVAARICTSLFSEVSDPRQYRGTGSLPLFSGCLSLFLSFLAQQLIPLVSLQFSISSPVDSDSLDFTSAGVASRCVVWPYLLLFELFEWSVLPSSSSWSRWPPSICRALRVSPRNSSRS